MFQTEQDHCNPATLCIKNSLHKYVITIYVLFCNDHDFWQCFDSPLPHWHSTQFLDPPRQSFYPFTKPTFLTSSFWPQNLSSGVQLLSIEHYFFIIKWSHFYINSWKLLCLSFSNLHNTCNPFCGLKELVIWVFQGLSFNFNNM